MTRPPAVFIPRMVPSINRAQHHLHRTIQPAVPKVGRNVARWILRPNDTYFKELQDAETASGPGRVKRAEVAETLAEAITARMAVEPSAPPPVFAPTWRQ
ncbi:hypothetical protein HK105_201573 [Polyrhizophydium stewartii]|uniref:Uncharacterized protein n=1 Tax=Polyrhizophydium stewartii TaxID=2732419 RepID=A0ABR4NGZ5_9FUNG